jgi:hypothetical protein
MLFQMAKLAQHAVPTKFVFAQSRLLISAAPASKPKGRVASHLIQQRESK